MMKKLRFLLPLAALGMLVSCSGQSSLPVNYDPENVDIDTPWEEYGFPVEEINFCSEDRDLTINVGDTHTYQYTVSPRDAITSGITFTSANEKIVSLAKNSDGKYVATGVAPGETTITVKGGEQDKFEDVTLNVTVELPISDFSVSTKSFELDYGQSEHIDIAFDPAETTQAEINYIVADESICSVDSEGYVVAKEKAGSTTIKVQSPYLNKEETVNVTVSDKYVYLTTFEVVPSENKVEVDKTFTLSVNTAPSTASADLNAVRYSTSTPELIRVDERSGEVTALKEGKAKVQASVSQRGGTKVSEEVEVEIYEVKLTDISLGVDSKQTINLNNRDNPTKQLEYIFTTDSLTETRPSRSDIHYHVEPEGVVTVSETGLVTVFAKGEARVTVMDDYSHKSDYVDFNVDIKVTSIVVTGNTQAYYASESITLKASYVPATVEGVNFEWTISPSDEGLSTDQDGDNDEILTLECNHAGEYVVTASFDGIVSEELTIKFEETPLEFENGKAYVVGTASYRDGASHEGESWNDANGAFIFKEKTTNPDAKYEWKGTVTFSMYDEWKIRENVGDWKDIEGYVYNEDGSIKYKTGEYKVTKGAFETGQMEVYNGNVKVNVPGTYDIYFAFYENEHPEGWYEVYVEEHGLKVDTRSLYLELGKEDGEFKVSNWYEDSLTVESKDESVVTVEVDSQGNATVHAVAAGSTKIIVKDDLKEIEISVVVVQINYRTLYLDTHGDFDADNCTMWAHAWDANGAQNYQIKDKVPGEEHIYTFTINEAYDNIIFTRNPSGATEFDWNTVYNQTADLKVPTDGKNMWAMSAWDDGNGKVAGDWKTYTPAVSTLSIDKTALSLYEAETGIITASNVAGTLHAESSKTDVATVEVEGNKITVTAVKEGTATITVTDGSSDSATCAVTVSKAPVINYKDFYLLDSKGDLAKDGAKLFVYASDNNGGMAYQLALAEEQTIVYTAKINEAYDHVEIVRCSNSATEIIWEGENINVWNKSDKVEIPSGKDMFVATGYLNNVIQGSWDKFDPEEEYAIPEDTVTRLYLDITECTWWANGDCAYAFLYKEGGANAGEWPGLKMTKVASKNLMYVDVTNIELYDRIIFVRYGENTVYNRSSIDGGTAIFPSEDGWLLKNTWKFNAGFAGTEENKVGYGDGNYSGSWTLTTEE